MGWIGVPYGTRLYVWLPGVGCGGGVSVKAESECCPSVFALVKHSAPHLLVMPAPPHELARVLLSLDILIAPMRLPRVSIFFLSEILSLVQGQEEGRHKNQCWLKKGRAEKEPGRWRDPLFIKPLSDLQGTLNSVRLQTLSPPTPLYSTHLLFPSFEFSKSMRS